MSQIGVVILIGGAAFAAGFTLALWLMPSAPPTSAGTLAFFASRLLAGVAGTAVALDIYSAVRRQSVAGELFEGRQLPADLAGRLSTAFVDAGVLLLLAVTLAVLGTRLAHHAVGRRS